MFNYSGKSMWPLCYSIMALPPSLRDKPHIGMSDAMLCTYDPISCTCYYILFHVHVILCYFMYMLLHAVTCTFCTCYFMLFYVHVITCYSMYILFMS
jgi:hypothetical protein